MIRVELDAPSWVTRGATSARGYANINKRYLNATGLADLFEACASDDDWTAALAQLNGCFAVLSHRGPKVLAAVDRIRSIPLFYAECDGNLLLCDSAHRAARGLNRRRLNAQAAEEFRLTGYVTGSNTLLEGVRQVEAGESLHCDQTSPERFQRRRYFDYRHRDFLSASTTALIGALEAVHAAVFRRLKESTHGRTIVVPLSGGYDSRLIGVTLRDLGVTDVICYTYGIDGNWEARISKELARYLGFRWEFVPYSAARWRSWAATDAFRQYFRAAGNLASVPHIQDWPAVHELVRDGRIPPESVFVPGHSGDFLAGSHIPGTFAKRPSLSRREVLDALENAHYSLWDWSASDSVRQRTQFDQRIEAIVGALPASCTAEEAADLFERWDLRERQAKFICNSVRVYESLNFEWRLPLFDAELMDFWARIPVGLRVGRKLYFEFARLRQQLPITEANTDRGRITALAVALMDRVGMRPLAKEVRRQLRRYRWRREYERSPLAWFALVDQAHFGRSYTGRELFHSYMALQYEELVRDEFIVDR